MIAPPSPCAFTQAPFAAIDVGSSYDTYVQLCALLPLSVRYGASAAES